MKTKMLLFSIALLAYATAWAQNTSYGGLLGVGTTAGTAGNINTFIGHQAGFSITTGGFNAFVGGGAGGNTTDGIANVYIGYTAGLNNTSGLGNVFIGFDAGRNELGSQLLYISNNNTAFPLIWGDFLNAELRINGSLRVTDVTQDDALTHVLVEDADGDIFWRDASTFGGTATFPSFPDSAGDGGTNTNSYFGHEAGLNNTGVSNTFLGYQSGINTTTGGTNVFVGADTGTANTTGSFNTFIGNESGEDNTTGILNVFIGGAAGGSNTTGQENTYVGVGAGALKTTGQNNVFMGRLAGRDNFAGDNNTFIGAESGFDNDGSGNVFLGFQAGLNETGSNLLYIDNSFTSSPLIWGDFSANELRVNGSLRITDVTQDDALTRVLVEDTDGDIHWRDASTFGGTATFPSFPDSAGDGGNNSNSYFGHEAGLVNTGTFNTFIGQFSGQSNTTGNENTFLGAWSGLSNTTGQFNTFIGADSGGSNTTGNNNTFIGDNSGFLNQTGSGNVFLGRQAGFNETGSNFLYIDNSNTADPLIWGDFSANELRVNGSLRITDVPQDDALTRVLVEDTDGDIHWRDAASLGDGVDDADADPANEYNTVFQVNGANLEITDNGGTLSVPVASLGDGVNDADADPNNEHNTVFQVNGANLEITDNGGTLSVPVAALGDGVNDADSDPTNEIETWATLAGIPAGFADGVDNVADADASPTNELQTLNYDMGTQLLSISGGNDVDLSSIGGSDNLGDHQVLQDLVPDTDDTYDLGANGSAYSNIWFDNALYVNDTEFLHTRDNSIAMGTNALSAVAGGGNNVAIGEGALESTTTGANNTAIGYRALFNNLTGANNTAIGNNARVLFNSASNSTAIGNGALALGSNQIRIGNSSVASIGGYEPWSHLSDARFKTNIKENIPGLEFITKLRPVSYEVDRPKLQDFLGEEEETMAFDSYRDNKKGIGFLAQEVEAVVDANNYVFTGVEQPQSEQDHYRIRYSDFVVPLVKGMQEQQQLIEALREEVETLKALIYGDDTSGNEATESRAAGFALYQNTPNPFKNTTVIKALVPEFVGQAKIIVYDLRGRELASYDLNQRGETSVEISAGVLPAGMYLYALTADGQLIDTKKMILTK